MHNVSERQVSAQYQPIVEICLAKVAGEPVEAFRCFHPVRLWILVVDRVFSAADTTEFHDWLWEKFTALKRSKGGRVNFLEAEAVNQNVRLSATSSEFWNFCDTI